MIWWISLGIVLLALVLFVLAFVPLLRRLPAARQVARRLQQRSDAVQRLQEGPVAALQEQILALAGKAALANDRIQVIQARRGKFDDN